MTRREIDTPPKYDPKNELETVQEFLNRLQPCFPVEKNFWQFVARIENKFGGAGKKSDSAPVWDADVLAQKDALMAGLPPETTDDSRREIEKAAYTAILLHGLNPDEKKRFRHEKKENGERMPYAMHAVRVARRLAGFSPDCIITALLHDCIEDTPFDESDVRTFFGGNVARMCARVTKVSTDTLQDVKYIEVGVAEAYLRQFGEQKQIAKILSEGERARGLVRNYPDLLLGENYAIGSNIGKMKEVLQEHLLQNPHAREVLTLYRLLYSLETDDDVAHLIVKCADVADNMASIAGLVSGKGKKRAVEKATLARDVFLPLARYLGCHDIAEEIEASVFPILSEKQAEKIKRAIGKNGYVPDNQYKEISQTVERFTSQCNQSVAEQYYPDMQGEPFSFRLDSPLPHQVERFAMDYRKALPSLIRLVARNQLAESLLIDYLNQDWAREMIRVCPEQTGNTVQGEGCAVTVQVKYARHWQNIPLIVENDGGDIADVYRPGSEERKKIAGQEKLRELRRDYRSGAFLPRLSRGTKRVDLIITSPSGKQTLHTRFYASGGDNAADVLILSGLCKTLSQPVEINGHPVRVTESLENGDTLLVSLPPYGGSSFLTPDMYDWVNTNLARNTIIQEMGKRREAMREKARRRGERILSWMTDQYVIEDKYKGMSSHERNPSVCYFPDSFWTAVWSLLETFPGILPPDITSQTLSEIGEIPEKFPLERRDLSFTDCKKWRKISPVGECANEMFAWTKQHCIVLFPRKMMQWEYATYLARMLGEYDILEYTSRNEESLMYDVISRMDRQKAEDVAQRNGEPFRITHTFFPLITVLDHHVKASGISERATALYAVMNVSAWHPEGRGRWSFQGESGDEPIGIDWGRNEDDIWRRIFGSYARI